MAKFLVISEYQDPPSRPSYMFSCFRSHGSDVSHGSGCRAGFFQGYAWCSLCLCSCRLTTRIGNLEVSPHHHHLGFFFGVNLDYLDFRPLIIDNCNVCIRWQMRLPPCALHEQSEHNCLFSYVLKSNWYRTDTPLIRMVRSTYAVDTSRVHFIRHTNVTCT